MDAIADQHLRAELVLARDKMAMPPEAIARSIAFAIEQPAGVDVGEMVVRPTAQG
ncbi:putative oxidoreductase [Caballeronia sordidicola]|uniref:Putative oxidoreductase n=1 Tax=Caballeronia sordidicola TaxID=196367 RepID=A0A242MM68_CABSO|nr:putative oxidoreductase [Caballeronia sordidicola]